MRKMGMVCGCEIVGLGEGEDVGKGKNTGEDEGPYCTLEAGLLDPLPSLASFTLTFAHTPFSHARPHP